MKEILYILDYIIETEFSFATRLLLTMASVGRPIWKPIWKPPITKWRRCLADHGEDIPDKIYGASLVAAGKEGSQYKVL